MTGGYFDIGHIVATTYARKGVDATIICSFEKVEDTPATLDDTVKKLFLDSNFDL